MDSLLSFVAAWLLTPNVLVSFAVAAIVIVLRAWSWLALGALNLVVLLGIPFTGRFQHLENRQCHVSHYTSRLFGR